MSMSETIQKLSDAELKTQIEITKVKLKKLNDGDFWFLLSWTAAWFPDINQDLHLLENEQRIRDERKKNNV